MWRERRIMFVEIYQYVEMWHQLKDEKSSIGAFDSIFKLGTTKISIEDTPCIFDV